MVAHKKKTDCPTSNSANIEFFAFDKVYATIRIKVGKNAIEYLSIFWSATVKKTIRIKK